MDFNLLTSRAVQLYDDFLKAGDPRLEGYYFMSSPLQPTMIVLAYLYFVTVLGPWFMENRKPFQLKNTMLAYNITVVCFSLYMIYEFMMAGWATGYNYRCDLVDFSESPMGLRMVRVCWLYYISKFVEMLDTVFFILRKKNSQVTFLHVYHHSIMAFTWWFGVKFAAGGLGTFHALLNCLVHVIMYSYYAVSALGPAYQKYLWWKKYMTTIQLVQFVMVTAHICQYFFMEDCPYQCPIFVFVIGSYGLVFLVLFLNFWYHAYTKGKRLPKAPQNSNGVHHTNGVSNGVHAKGFSNGVSNGIHSNGVSNGIHSNGVSNGIHSNGVSNGIHSNGVSNGIHSNGVSNGVHANGFSNGVHANGFSNGVHANGFSNGLHANGISNGVHHANGISNGVHYGNGVSNGGHYRNGLQHSNCVHKKQD